MRRFIALLAVTAAFACGVADAQQVSAPAEYVPVEKRLTTEQLHATGLDTLSREQLELLNRLLRDEQSSLVAETTAHVERDRARRASEPVTSTIKGPFRGWQKGIVFELANGQRWRVVDDADYYIPRALIDPKVTMAPGTLGSWNMEVEGVRPVPKVRRVEP